MRVSSVYIKTILHRFEREGISSSELLKFAKLKVRDLNHERWLPYEAFVALWDAASRTKDDHFLGLHLGEKFNPLSIGIVGYMVHASDNVAEALSRMAQYNMLIGDFVEYSKEHIGSVVKVDYRINPLILDENVARHVIESEMAATIAGLQSLTQREVYPDELSFTFHEPEDLAEYQRIFKCKLKFGQTTNALILKCEYLNLPVVTGNSELAEILEQHAAAKLLEAEGQPSVTERTRRTITQRLSRGQSPTLEGIAEALNYSVRTLQRKLKEEGFTFHQVVDEISFDLAKKYLGISHLTIAEVAYLLGYSDPSIFTRSFKRKSGKTPESFRNRKTPADLN